MNQYSKRPDTFKDNLMETIDTEEKAYWLGFLYADGSVGSTDNRIELTLAEKDLRHIEKFKEFIGLDNKISYRPKTKAYRFCFKNKKFKEYLIKQGCVPQKSLILQFPSPDQVPTELLRHFLRGYFDGDGCICNTENTFEVGFISSKDFIVSFLQQVPLDINKEHKIYDVHHENGAKKYGLYTEHDARIFLDYLYKDATIYLDRKYSLYLEYVNNNYKRNKDIKRNAVC